MQQTIRTFWKASAWIFAGTGVAAGILYLRLPWTQRFDFDVLGFAWLFLNAPKLGAFVVMVLSFSFAAYSWLRSRLGG